MGYETYGITDIDLTVAVGFAGLKGIRYRAGAKDIVDQEDGVTDIGLPVTIGVAAVI